MDELVARVLAVVDRIPPGRVLSYGDVAALASREALSTTTTSSSWGPAAAGSVATHAARSSALS